MNLTVLFGNRKDALSTAGLSWLAACGGGGMGRRSRTSVGDAAEAVAPPKPVAQLAGHKSFFFCYMQHGCT